MDHWRFPAVLFLPSEDSPSETIVLNNGTINQYTSETLSEQNVDVSSRGVNWSREPSALRACNNMDLEGKRRDDPIKAAESEFSDDPRSQDSAGFKKFVTPEMDANIYAQNEMMQTAEGECRLDMETLDIVQEEGTTSTYSSY